MSVVISASHEPLYYYINQPEARCNTIYGVFIPLSGTDLAAEVLVYFMLAVLPQALMEVI